ncbi:MAG: aminotransferase class I/II-fold pyridoxal phosphate-dependent enzyme [Candidatus Thermoplasmatota archaeon]|nr:aminotransferase class I/II-fold pyridoxal phosphate-dependent enzyme [Candidatus Thermoplasmatota archaeon]
MTTGHMGDGDWRLSDMANGMERSRILTIAASVRQMISQGKDVAPFTVGDFSPEQFDVPNELISGIIDAVSQRETNYPPAAGLPELRESLANWMSTKYGLDVGSDGIIVGSGARPVLYSSFRLFLEPGDGLAHGVPAWNNHYYVHLNDAVAIPIKGTPESRFLPTAESIKERIHEIRVLILNSPLNPTGTCYTRDELRSICQVIMDENRIRQEEGRKPVMLVYDQVYSTMTAKHIEHIHPVQVCPEIFDYTITLDAISKSLTGTGLRLGWMALPPALAPPVVALIGHMGAWPARPIQKAAAELYSKTDILEQYFTDLDGKIADRMAVLQNRLSDMSGYGVSYVEPEGGIYLTTRFDLFEKLNVNTNEEIRQWLLESAGVAIVPFQAFGLEDDSGWFRISVGAVGVDDIHAAMNRLESALIAAFDHEQSA